MRTDKLVVRELREGSRPGEGSGLNRVNNISVTLVTGMV